MLNTWGLFSINRNTFSSNLAKGKLLPKETRQYYYTLLKINNLILNPLGYLPKASYFSGITRMLIHYYVFFTPYQLNPALKKLATPWKKEIRSTCIAQIARGTLEAFIPFGKILNLGLDVVASYGNLTIHLSTLKDWDKLGHNTPPSYSGWKNILYFV